ncbi:MAG: PEP-CTERM sorting domain-containing protein [Proteobacteria bacterium]|nr:PEP-CTERM sorting domain-containing protein [Pseudomonadota bacterium]
MSLFRLGLALLVLFMPVQSHANTITFEDVPLYAMGAFSSGGFNFSLNGQASLIVNTQFCSGSCPVNGTNFVLAPYGPSSLTMSQTGGGAFSLTGFDGAGSFNFNPYGAPQYIPTQIDVVALLSGGGSVSQSFLIDKTSNAAGALNFTSYLFNSAFTNLASVTFSSSGSASPTFNGFSVDNIITGGSAVPEPATGALLLTGLGLIGFTARRRKNLDA